MRKGGDPRRRLHRATSALLALTLLPVGVMVATVHSPMASMLGWTAAPDPATVRSQDTNVPMAEAFQRGLASGLFAPFSWDGNVASGPFVQFDYLDGSGPIAAYFLVNGSQTSILVDSISVAGFAPNAPPVVAGATFITADNDTTIIAHDEPTALLEIRTLSLPRSVILTFPAATTDLQVSRSDSWPAASLAFTSGGNNGRLIVGRGGLALNGTTVTASLAANDYLALRAVPGSSEHAMQRTALLDAFGSGRLAAEFALVAVSSGGWLENSARYHDDLVLESNEVQFNRAVLKLQTAGPQDGLVLLAFDPDTMPADSQHRLNVMANGVEIPEAADPLASLFALPGSTDHATYARLSMNATVLVVYVPDLSSASLEVESVALPPPGLDGPTQMAIVAAVFLVAVSAAVMFRRRPE